MLVKFATNSDFLIPIPYQVEKIYGLENLSLWKRLHSFV